MSGNCVASVRGAALGDVDSVRFVGSKKRDDEAPFERRVGGGGTARAIATLIDGRDVTLRRSVPRGC